MDDVIVDELVRRTARGLLPRAVELSAQVSEAVLQVVPELAPARTPDAVLAVRESTEQNVGAMLSTLAFGITPSGIEPPTGTQSLLRNLIADGGNATHLLRAYRIGHEQVWRIWSDHVHEEVDPSARHAVLRVSSTHLFNYVDRACQRITEDHDVLNAVTATATAPAGIANRHELVRMLLASDTVDLRAASASLDYDVLGHHVALVAVPLAESASVRRELQRVIDSVGVPALVSPSTKGTWWSWLGASAAPLESELAAVTSASLDGVLIGVGEPSRGRDGFRRSHLQAVEAQRTGCLVEHPSAGAVRHRDIEVAALLCSDPERARRLAVERLGPLTVRDDTSRRLRETVRALLAHGHNRGQTARALNVHIKTVTYRVAQVEELLGRDLTKDTSDLDTALLIDRTLYGP